MQQCGTCREGLMCFHHCTLFTLALQTLASRPVPWSSSIELHPFFEQKDLKNCKENVKCISWTIKDKKLKYVKTVTMYRLIFTQSFYLIIRLHL